MAAQQKTEIKSYAQLKLQGDAAQCRVASIAEGMCSLSSYSRRDFYKVTLILAGSHRLQYADRDVVFNQPALVFTNPLVPYSWEINDTEQSGYFCVFTEDFLHNDNRMESLQQSSLFKPGGEPVYLLSDEQVAYATNIFTRMRAEVDSEYVYKHELIRSQLNLLIHEAIKMQPAVAYYTPQNAASRIAKLFLALLEKQFPIESQQHTLALKKAGDYADKLAVHVNHLNAAVQEVTGKSTTAHINERLLAEAKSLLQHTDWSVSDIGYSLGFEYSSYFNTFFKKHLGLSPLAARKTL